jgi:hypothetical protein
VHDTVQGVGSTVPRPRSKPTDPNIKAAAVETARQCLTRLIIDVVSFSEQGIGPTDGTKSRREHAFAFVRTALLPGATARMKKIARDVALPIIAHEEADRRFSPNARRDQILVDTVQLVCTTHNLHPTRRSGQAESGCSIVAEALQEFLAELPKYADEQFRRLRDSKYHELRKFVIELPDLLGKLFPEGALSEQRLNNIWDGRLRS